MRRCWQLWVRERAGRTTANTRNLQQDDLRLSSPPSGQGTSGGARTCDRRVPADLRANLLATVPPTPHNKVKISIQEALQTI
ncbi:hypothetical protein PoB_007370500 [Plakobranchus ocellatus]|uniref:Uncharacterized protein n=1 Tax=Plakobranchus ocellatus TaxID=259542 RepID=A0AAV4DSS5_9GAST|nr:hypothetical protein PoB_007370500 [Plakobranchus ocellatus]